MIARLFIMFYAIASYAVFFVSFIWALGFVGNYNQFIAKSIDTGPPGDWGEAILIDVALLALFALQHSVMARPAFKRWWTRVIPAAAERSTYVLLTSLMLLLLFWQWRPIPAPVWQAEGIVAASLTGMHWLGWLIVLASTYMINHFDLFGLRQALFALRGTEAPPEPFKAPLLYRLVRHPLMLGFLLAFWATPTMTVGHLLFAVLNTAYILVGLQLEERDLIAAFGETYQRYRERVPMLLPRLIGGRRPAASETGVPRAP
ncbi:MULTISPECIES: methanethiol S-methyltransferase [Bradyrhizobium]|jgi:protein-S-isoprenylcysteine O-methyltransferase Ste14|uniref:methanethiol S-methyltransferase n=1 Tax=Bradyrhizobium denitrificans TaxID=2734912 RepID=A0ABS5GIJ9_9BRAD|nr:MULTISPECIES: methanethiol S-methyltransferase [Bradyrhizobium]MBR1141162.1 isoprenylcysteine carboxylmethyltransferase family protein [Bradyrhizobium denitrificans]MDU0958062.1 NnrU family protein [Bradyrhizobium sp.]MDU1491091.1 NnrU family protein [Bradyrhizobium sp.]MDU1541269.1 NnrU family protein [Bradyrhizobium sp.]MDU1808238.1 NnrU family protein [Bradyrhizobium sp.]